MIFFYVLLSMIACGFYYRRVTEKKITIAFINYFCISFLLFFIEGIIENYDLAAQSITIPLNGIIMIWSASMILAIVAVIFSLKKPGSSEQ